MINDVIIIRHASCVLTAKVHLFAKIVTLFATKCLNTAKLFNGF